MGSDLSRLHHVGHVVGDLAAALGCYRRLGFAVPPPSYPAMAAEEGAEPEPFGAANTHADFPHDFVELATHVRAGSPLPDDALLVPLHAPADVLATVLDRIADTSAAVGAFLDRFEGLHILMFAAPDIDATAARLTEAGVGHGGVHTVTRPVETGDATVMETVRYLEIDDTPEGRIGIVAELDERIQATRAATHPNGAVALADAVLCASAAELPAVLDRYARYLGRPARPDGSAAVFDLDGARLTVVAEDDLSTLLPGERAPALPSVVAYTVAVRDVTFVENLLLVNGIPVQHTAGGDPFVPASAALGAAIVFTRLDALE